MTAAPFRAVRGTSVAVVGVSLAWAAHGAVAREDMTTVPVVGVCAALAVAVCVALSASAWTARRLLAVLVGIQCAVHVALVLAMPSAAADPRLVAISRDTHHHGPPASTTPSMLLAHAVAVVVATGLLARVDTAIQALVRLAARLVPSVVAPVAMVRRVPSVSAAALVASRARSDVLWLSPRRGPPVCPGVS